MSVCLLARSVVVVEAEKLEEEKELKKTGGGSYFRLLTETFSFMFTLPFHRTNSRERSINHNYQIVE